MPHSHNHTGDGVPNFAISAPKLEASANLEAANRREEWNERQNGEKPDTEMFCNFQEHWLKYPQSSNYVE